MRELELELDAGFSVLTGETGAGKSILVDALQLALGARGDAGVVREGAARAEISAEFDLPPALVGWLQEAGFDAGDDACCCAAASTPGQEPRLDQRQRRHGHAVARSRPTSWSTSTASTPGKA